MILDDAVAADLHPRLEGLGPALRQDRPGAGLDRHPIARPLLGVGEIAVGAIGTEADHRGHGLDALDQAARLPLFCRDGRLPEAVHGHQPAASIARSRAPSITSMARSRAVSSVGSSGRAGMPGWWTSWANTGPWAVMKRS